MIFGASSILAAGESVQQQFEFLRLPQGWWAVGSVVLLAALFYAVIYFYRNEGRAGAPMRVRMFLAGVRCLVVALLAVIWLEPILATYIHRTIEAATILLVDRSASMNVRDLYPVANDARRVAEVVGEGPVADGSGVVRTDLVSTVFTRDEARLIEQLRANNRVRVFGFANDVTPLGEFERKASEAGVPTTQPTGALAAMSLPKATGTATNIGRALRHAIETQGDEPVAAVVVFSDGRFNQGEPPEVAARYAKAKRIAVHAVGVGDPAPPRNVAVRAVDAPPNVFVKDPFRLTVHLQAQGMNGGTLAVQLIERAEGDDAEKIVDTKQAPVGADGNIEPLVFSRTVSEAAMMRYIARVIEQPGETLLDDNASETTVRALDNKMRVLVVAGSPSWEYRYLMRMLTRDETVELSCWLQSADEEAVRDGDAVIEQFPAEPSELFEYDCVVMLDPQPLDIDPAWTTHLETMVSNQGAGFIYVAGRTHSQRFMHSPNTGFLLNLLPVVIDTTEADLIINEQGHYQSTPWPIEVPDEAISHSVVRLADNDVDNAALWAHLPGVYWHYPTRREKPVATVLMRHSNPRMRNAYGSHVLLATQFFGAGRTAYLGFDTTWRWRRLGQERFNQFWIQFLRHMVEGKLLSGQKRGLIQPGRDRYAVGEPVVVDARLLDARHQPMERSGVELAVRTEDGTTQRVELAAQPNRPGWYQARFVATHTGRHELMIELPGGEGADAATIRGQFQVSQPDLEFRQIELNEPALETLALESLGGQYIHINETGELPNLIPSKTTELVLDGQPISLWDRGWTLIVLIVLLGVEWAVRKRARLL